MDLTMLLHGNVIQTLLFGNVADRLESINATKPFVLHSPICSSHKYLCFGIKGAVGKNSYSHSIVTGSLTQTRRQKTRMKNS